MHSRLAPPAWLVSSLTPQTAPIPWPAVCRAGIAMATPLAVGLAAGQPAYGALVSMGALSGVIGDTADAYRMRVFNIAVPQFFGALGVLLGTIVFGHGWFAVIALTLVALASGMMSTIGAVASVSGLLLLLNSVIGAGLPLPGPWWKAPLLLACGGLFVLFLALLAWPLRRQGPERASVAAAYRAVADLLDAAGQDTYAAKRQAVTQALNTSYDLLLARRAREHGRSAPFVRLLSALNVLIPLVEAAPAAHLHGAPLPAGIASAVRELAVSIETGRTGKPETGLPDPAPDPDRGPDHDPAAGSPSSDHLPSTSASPAPTELALDLALRHAAAVVHEADPDPYNVDDRLGRPSALSIRARRATRNVLLSEGSWRYGLRLALCIGIAQSLVSLIAVPRSYWVALTVTFVLKPDFGSVFSRALLRALGTAVGLVVAAAVLSQVPRGWWDVPVLVLLAALIPAASAKGYAYQTAAITPVILLLSDVLNHQGFALVLPRLGDSLIGCGIALVAGYLLWPESWQTRIGDRLASAVDDTAHYVETAFGPATDHASRTRLRRRLYRDLSTVRTEFQRALTEPPPTGTRAAAWWPLVVAVERVVDATTAARVRVDHGAPDPAASEVEVVASQLRELAVGVRASDRLVEVRAELPGDEDSVLAPLRQEVSAARAITSPEA